MKNKKMKLCMSLSVIFIGVLISTSMLNSIGTQALTDTNKNQSKLDSFDRFAWEWSTTNVVSTESIASSAYPTIATDNEGNVHIAWRDSTDYDGCGTDQDIFYNRWDASTATWGTTEVVSTESTDSSWAQDIVVDIEGNVFLVWYDYTDYAGSGTDGDIFYKHRTASTSTWSTTEVVSTESTENSGHPSIAIDIKGNLHVTWHDTTDYASCGTDFDIFYKHWDFPTSSWGSTEVVSTESIGISWTPDIVVDVEGGAYVVWYDGTNILSSGTDMDIFYKHRIASDSTWTTTEIVSTESTSESNQPFIALDLAGNLHVAWNDFTDYGGAGSDWDVFYKRWDDSLSTWTVTEIISTEGAGVSYWPSLDVDTSGNVHISWQDTIDHAGSGSDGDIFYRRWEPSSNLWTNIEVVSTESTDLSDFPSLALDLAGNVHISWSDGTDYNSAGSDGDIFYKQFAGPPAAPDLAFIVPNPTELTGVYLDWNDVLGATSYHIYRSSSYISSVEGLTPITTVSSSEFDDTLPSEGFYYYVIIAQNFVGESDLSNCQYIEYKLPTLDEFILISSLIIGLPLFLFVATQFRKKKSKLN
jgi:hypothetical protein